MARLFGTDGVRGVANQDLTAELALALGSAAAKLGTHTGRVRSGSSARRVSSTLPVGLFGLHR
jgi:phosphomannomutase